MTLHDSMPNHILSSISSRRTSSKGPASSRRSQSAGHTTPTTPTPNVNNRHSASHTTSNGSSTSNSGTSGGGGGGRSSRSGTSTPSASSSRPSSPSSREEQAFHLTTGGHGASPWLTLRVKSNASPSRTHPLYFDKDVVEGSVHLNLTDNPSTIVGVVVFVKGYLMSVGADQLPFLELSQTLWSASMGHPNETSMSTNSAMPLDSQATLVPPARHSPFTGRLSGSYAWPFAIPLPTQVVLNSNPNGQPVAVPLPPSFAPKGVPTFIDYKIQVLVQRGPLRVDSTLTTSFVYLPRARAPRPSRRLESAYQGHHPILGPSLDPEGWETLPKRTLSGVLFGARKASVDCTLSISRPMRAPVGSPRADRASYSDYGHVSSSSSSRTYARDCPIHLNITLESYDTQLLDLFSSPSALKLQLVQQIRRAPADIPHHPHPHTSNSHHHQSHNHHSQPYTIHKIFKSDPETEFDEPVVVGTCTRSSSANAGNSGGAVASPSVYRRHFEADLVVRKDLKPSFYFPSFSLQYSVQLILNVPGFSAAQNALVFSEPVTIVTDRPRGPSAYSRTHTT
ncbi:hypothetical protein CPB86DRAFT_829381 [Serendipita vermifera]|nr:hypothetical protein CPB86DRAFT_829381 [Serendipita vermifera]